MTIEWKHYDKEGETCTRCNSTGNNIKAVLGIVSTDNAYKNIQIKYKETILEASEMPDSNTVLINGQKIEDVLNAKTSENYCHSCSCLAGSDTNCRTIELNNKSYESIPKDMILEAINKSITSSHYTDRKL